MSSSRNFISLCGETSVSPSFLPSSLHQPTSMANKEVLCFSAAVCTLLHSESKSKLCSITEFSSLSASGAKLTTAHKGEKMIDMLRCHFVCVVAFQNASTRSLSAKLCFTNSLSRTHQRQPPTANDLQSTENVLHLHPLRSLPMTMLSAIVVLVLLGS